MHTLRLVVVAPLILCLAISAPAFAQQRHAVDPSLLARTVDQHVARHDADRAAIREALAGGASTVVISTTTIIIALLVVILLIVALR